jgi:hypothetical protein
MYSSLYLAMVVISHFYSVGVQHARLTLSAALCQAGVGLFKSLCSTLRARTALGVPGRSEIFSEHPNRTAAAWSKCARCRKTSRPKWISIANQPRNPAAERRFSMANAVKRGPEKPQRQLQLSCPSASRINTTAVLNSADSSAD